MPPEEYADSLPINLSVGRNALFSLNLASDMDLNEEGKP